MRAVKVFGVFIGVTFFIVSTLILYSLAQANNPDMSFESGRLAAKAFSPYTKGLSISALLVSIIYPLLGKVRIRYVLAFVLYLVFGAVISTSIQINSKGDMFEGMEVGTAILSVNGNSYGTLVTYNTEKTECENSIDEFFRGLYSVCPQCGISNKQCNTYENSHPKIKNAMMSEAIDSYYVRSDMRIITIYDQLEDSALSEALCKQAAGNQGYTCVPPKFNK